MLWKQNQSLQQYCFQGIQEACAKVGLLRFGKIRIEFGAIGEIRAIGVSSLFRREVALHFICTNRWIYLYEESHAGTF